MKLSSDTPKLSSETFQNFELKGNKLSPLFARTFIAFDFRVTIV